MTESGRAMNRFLPLLKIGAILVLTVLLLVPMVRIHGLIRERQALRDGVVQDIARSAAYAQTLTGPLLIVPYTRKLQEQQLDADRKVVTVTREVAGELRLLPATMDLTGKLATEERQRGIYRARIFNADTKLTGHFDIAADYGVLDDVPSYRFGAPRLVLGISDIRGIGNALTLQANGGRVNFEPGTGTDAAGQRRARAVEDDGHRCAAAARVPDRAEAAGHRRFPGHARGA